MDHAYTVALGVFLANAGITVGGLLLFRLLSLRNITAAGFYLVMSLLPTFALVFPSVVAEHALRDGFWTYKYALILHSSAFLVGAAIVQYGLRSTKVSKNLTDITESRSEHRVVLVLISALVISLLHQLITLDTVPILVAFLSPGETATLTIHREASYKMSESLGVYFWHFMRQVGTLVLVCILVASVVVRGRRASKHLAGTGLVVALAVFHNSLSAAKAPVAILFLAVFFGFVLLGVKMRLRVVVGSILVTLSFPVMLEWLYSDTGFFSSAWHTYLKVFERFSLGVYDRTLAYFDVFVEPGAKLGGRTNSLFALITGQSHFNVQNFVFLERLDVIREHLVHGSLNAHFISYMYSDFGLVGVWLSSLVVGMVVSLGDVAYKRCPRSLLVVSIYAAYIVVVWKLMGSQPTSVFASHGGGVLLLCLFYLSRRGARQSRRGVLPNVALSMGR